MGNSASKKMDRYYGNYEKNFERVEKDMQRVKGQLASRARSRSQLSMWSSVLVAVAVAIAGAIIYQVQQQPSGTFTYQQHFQRTASAAAVPCCAVLLHWVAALWMDLAQRRDGRKLQRLEAAQKTMLKELKEMINYDKVKLLIDKFDPDARAAHLHQQMMAAAAQQQGGRMGGAANGMQRRQGKGGMMMQQQGGQGQQVPAMLMKGSGQVAGAAALAVAGAGRALMPLVDKLATTLISDNPVLLEDLRRAQQQLQEAQDRTVSSVQESLGLKHENLELKMRLVELEKQLGNVPLSYEPEVLQEQQSQLYQATQQAAWQMELQQQYLGVVVGGGGAAVGMMQGQEGGDDAARSAPLPTGAAGGASPRKGGSEQSLLGHSSSEGQLTDS